MTKDEALKLAHEALKKFHYAMIDAGVLDRQEVLNEGFTAATAIKEALAQHDSVQAKPEPEHEPVKVLHKHEWFRTNEMKVGQMRCISCGVWGQEETPQRTWQGLTDEEIAQGCKESWVTEQAWQSAVWWAEAKLKEKNNAA